MTNNNDKQTLDADTINGKNPEDALDNHKSELSASDVKATPSEPAVKLYGKMLTFSRLKLTTNDTETIKAELANLLGNTSSQIPVVLDSELEQDLPALLDVLWNQGLQPIGVVSGVNDKQAKAERLAIFPPEGTRIERVERVVPRANATRDTKSTATTDQPSNGQINEQNALLDRQDRVHEQLLRSGQSINHVGGDLILTRSVNQGAEVITDHNLHIYGRAKGRLVAGATGDKHARIFCQDFNPSLVSVAGTYCLQGDIPPEVLGKAVQVSFVEGQGLVFQLFGGDETYSIAPTP